MKIDLFIGTTKNHIESVIHANLSQDFLRFDKVDTFPRVKGIYFIYDIKQNTSTPIYIGSTPKQTILQRCKQYISPSNTGGKSFRQKVYAVYELNKRDEVIPYINKNFAIRYIDANGLSISDILLLERACISSKASTLPLNDYKDEE